MRNPFEAPHVKSRRGGPVKRPLSRDAIVTEALRQLMSEGLEGMSIRKIAAALETGPASLYAYIEDLNELRALVLDRALARVNLRDAANTSWRERLHAALNSYARVLASGPGLAQIAFGAIAVGPNALRVTEKLLALLEEGGVDPATGAWAVDLLILYVTAIVAEPDWLAAGVTVTVRFDPLPAKVMLLLGTSTESEDEPVTTRLEASVSASPITKLIGPVEVLELIF